MKFIGHQCVADTAEIDVYECECGYHFGVDVTYLDQVGPATVHCPSCKKVDVVDGADEDNTYTPNHSEDLSWPVRK